MNIVVYSRCCPATAKTSAKTFDAPACFNVFAHSFNVAPVVLMSSTRQIFFPAKLWPFRTAKASATLAALLAGLAAKGCGLVLRMRARSMLIFADGCFNFSAMTMAWL